MQMRLQQLDAVAIKTTHFFFYWPQKKKNTSVCLPQSDYHCFINYFSKYYSSTASHVGHVATPHGVTSTAGDELPLGQVGDL